MLKDKNKRYRDRILASVLLDEAGCWIWQKSKYRNGYGKFAIGGGVVIGAHRASYVAFVGEIPSGLDVCHSCDVRDCVNPEHLFRGTRSENILDASKKNRVSRTHQKRGEANPQAKLDGAKVHEILSRLNNGETKASIARSFSVTDRVVLLISRGQLWKHIERAI